MTRTKRKKHQSHENHERWLVSYADFITLLFAFFVVMFATSQTDKNKAKAVADSVKEALDGGSLKTVINEILGGALKNKGQGSAKQKGPAGELTATQSPAATGDAQIAELLPFLKLLTSELADEIKKGELQIGMGARGLTISFTQAALFPSGEDVISEETYPSIRKIAAAIQEIPNPVRMEGHTDAVPIHTSRFRSNWDLSAARSIALLALFTTFGVCKDQLSIAGYADTAPVDNNDTAEGRQKNRRVDIVILNRTGVKGEPTRAGTLGTCGHQEALKPKS
jgi:chemotaxis protein MotB